MPQRSQYDDIILDLIKSGEIKVDTENGFIYGKSTDLQGTRRRIGHRTSDGNIRFTFMFSNKSLEFYVCRAVWLASGQTIPRNLIVRHKNNIPEDNKLSNLTLAVYNRAYESPQWWSQVDIEWLKSHYQHMTLPELASHCQRSVKAIRHKIKNINLPKKKAKNPRWTKEEDELLVNLYQQKKSVAEISAILKRSEASIRLEASRKLKAFRSDRHLQANFRGKHFYLSLKKTLCAGTSKAKCCLCGYSKYIELHHIDGNNRNHEIGNIASLCGNCHTEVEHGEHVNKMLFCVWWRLYSDGSVSETMDNKMFMEKKANGH